MTAADIAAVARGLTEAQRAFLCAASAHPKTWLAIRRHAKLSPTVRVHKMVRPLGLIDHGDDFRRFRLTPLGLAVRAYLMEQSK